MATSFGNALTWSQWGDGITGPLLDKRDDPFHGNRGWHHVAVTLNGSNNIGVVLFLDGVPVARRFSYQIDTPAGSTFLMGRIPGANGDNRRMHGEVDEVTVYNRDLLPDEIAAIHRWKGRQMQTIAKELMRRQH